MSKSDNTVSNLLNILNGRPIVIWGARMTGIGFRYFSQKHNLNILGFIDSDPSLEGTMIYDLPIRSPNSLSTLKEQNKNLIVMVAVSTKEDEIIDSLKKMGMAEDDYINYKNFCKIFLTIDVSGACNLKCPSCANSISSIDCKKGYMSLDDFKKIMGKLIKEAGLINHVCLYNWGEPLLHPQLDLFINYAHQIGVAAAVSTNFSINSDSQLHRLVKSSPDILKISLSGYYPNTYNETHAGGNINLVKSNLYKLKYYMDKNHSSFPVEVNYHLYKHNIGSDLGKMKDLCQELGFILSTTYANITPVERIIKYCQGDVDGKTKEFLKLLLVSLDKGLEISKPFRHLPCRFLSNQLNINWNRSVSLCCVSCDDNKSIISNDFLQDSLEDINKLKKNHTLCSACMEYGIHQYFLGVDQKAWEKEANQYAK